MTGIWERIRTSLFLRAIPVYLSASRAHFWGLGAVIVMLTALGLAFTVVTGLLVGAVPPAVQEGLDGDAGRRLYLLLGAVAAIQLSQAALGPLQGALSFALGSRMSQLVRERIAEASLGPAGVAHLEDPSFADEVRLAQTFPTLSETASAFFFLAQMRLAALGSGVLLLGFAWWAPIVIGVGAGLQHRWATKEIKLLYDPFVGTAEPRRRAEYFRDLALGSAAAKEIRVFGLATWVVDRFAGQWTEAMRRVWRERRSMRTETLLALGILVVTHGLVYALLGRAALRGEVSLAALAIYAQAITGMRGLGAMSDYDYIFKHGLRTLPHLLELDARARQPAADLHGTVHSATAPGMQIRFEKVSFRYPGTDEWIFDELDLTIPAGRSLALVGQNGAGKTTMIKLLGRLYDPDAGRITVDGVDLRDLDPAAWREWVAVIFQDFTRFELPARDNVGFGRLEAADDRDTLDKAAGYAGATELIAGLTSGWDTILSRGYRGGLDLSGGEWQKVALSRALMTAAGGRGGVLVLDEPTANLDVRAEVELFDRFLDMTRGLTTILISHRFSTVRRAERICVLEHGRVVEDGSHSELLLRDGIYARMFNLQASKFAEGEVAL